MLMSISVIDVTVVIDGIAVIDGITVIDGIVDDSHQQTKIKLPGIDFSKGGTRFWLWRQQWCGQDGLMGSHTGEGGS